MARVDCFQFSKWLPDLLMFWSRKLSSLKKFCFIFSNNHQCNSGGTAGGGAPLVTQYWGGTKHFFLLILYNFRNIWGGGTCPPGPPSPYSAVPAILLKKLVTSGSVNVADIHVAFGD